MKLRLVRFPMEELTGRYPKLFFTGKQLCILYFEFPFVISLRILLAIIEGRLQLSQRFIGIKVSFLSTTIIHFHLIFFLLQEFTKTKKKYIRSIGFSCFADEKLH